MLPKNKKNKAESKEEKIAKFSSKLVLFGTAITAVVTLITGISVEIIKSPWIGDTAAEVQYFKDAKSQTLEELQDKNDQLKNAQDVFVNNLENEKDPRKKQAYQSLVGAIGEGRETNYQTQKQFVRSADNCISETKTGLRVEAAECRKTTNQILIPEIEGRKKVIDIFDKVKSQISPNVPDVSKPKESPSLNDVPSYRKRSDDVGIDDKHVRGMNERDRDKNRDRDREKERMERIRIDGDNPRDTNVRKSPQTERKERPIDREVERDRRNKSVVD